MLRNLYIFLVVYCEDGFSADFFNSIDWLPSYQCYCNRFGNIDNAIKKAKKLYREEVFNEKKYNEE